MFEDSRLKIFLTVARTGNFTCAARELGITQPAVSQSVAQLEKDLGRQLFERGRNEVTLTQQGLVFKSYADKIQYWYGAVSDMFATLGPGVPKRPIRLMAGEMVADYILPPVILALKASDPELDFIISAYDEEPDISLSLSRRNGVLDFSGEIAGTVRAVAFTSNHAYASLAALEDAGPGVRFAVWKPYVQFLPLDITSRICLAGESAGMIKQMVSAETETIGILPFPAVKSSGLQLISVPLPHLQCDLRLRAGDSPLGRKFAEILSDNL